MLGGARYATDTVIRAKFASVGLGTTQSAPQLVGQHGPVQRGALTLSLYLSFLQVDDPFGKPKWFNDITQQESFVDPAKLLQEARQHRESKAKVRSLPDTWPPLPSQCALFGSGEKACERQEEGTSCPASHSSNECVQRRQTQGVYTTPIVSPIYCDCEKRALYDKSFAVNNSIN